MAPRHVLAIIAPAAVVALGLGLTSCGGDQRSIPGFCKLLRENADALTDTSDPGGLAELYQRLDERAPLQIKDQWHTVTSLVVRMTTFNPKSEEDTQRLIAETLSSQRAIQAVGGWADTKCKVPLGNVTATTMEP
jgi:hypothetical protein